MPPFKAIIVGGGPVGLAMGHALALAGLDFVILERASKVAEPGAGASLALWPHSARVLDQFGLLEEARALAVIMRHKRNHGPDGRELSRNNMFEVVEQNHGHPWMLFSRSALIDLLARRLPGGASRIKTGKMVVRIESSPDDVAAHCGDGSVERGSIIIGCDGVYSRVRVLMEELAVAGAGSPPKQSAPMRSSYQALVGYAPRPAGLEPATVYEARGGAGSSFHVLTGPSEAYFFAYRRLAEPTTERRRYGDAEAAALAETMRHGHITEDVRFGALWDQRTWSVLTDLQEGNTRTWWHGRVVLVGDAVHKMTPNAGFSMNTGWQGVVELTNHLRRVVRKYKEGGSPGEAAADEGPTVDELGDEVFAPYQRGRETLAKTNGFCSAVYTRVAAWQNWLLRMADWVAPYLGGDVLLLNILASRVVCRGITLDFVEEKNHRTGTIPWMNKPVVLDEKTTTTTTTTEEVKAVEA